MSSHPRLGAFLILTSVIGVSALAQGIPADNVLRDFHQIGDYILVVDGKEVPAAEIYQSERAGSAILVLSSAFPSPLLLSPRSNTVEAVNLMKVAKKRDGTVDLLADAVLAPQGALELSDENVLFTIAGHKAALKPKPPLLGLRRAAEVTAHNPEYLTGIKAYTSNGPAIAALKKERQPVTVRVYYGSWCPHCRMMVPHALKIEQQLQGSKIRFEYFGLPQNFSNDPAALKAGVKGVPTGIVFVNGKETGRIRDHAWSSPESALRDILDGKGKAEAGK
ncbi:MAG TPA: thioredoxin family protein [Thermoanaerobaculia bacterium]|nr:thioredoxin family protein [Thermoanaerobaculia bacterium]